MGKSKGFSLIEVLMATVIISLGSLLVANSLLNSLKILSSSQQRLIALSLMEEEINRLRTLRKEEELKGYKEELIIDNRSFFKEVDIFPIVAGENVTLNETVISITWQEANLQRNLQLRSYLP